jgi:subtilisin family serine protease
MKNFKISLLLITFVLIVHPFAAISAIEEIVSAPVSYPLSEPASEEISTTEVVETVSEFDKFKRLYKDLDQEKFNAAKDKSKKELEKKHHDDYLIVKFKSSELVDSVTERIDASDIVSSKFSRSLGETTRLIKIKNQEDKLEKLTKLNLEDAVEYVEVNQVATKSAWTIDSGAQTAKPSDYNNTNHYYYTKTKLPETFYAQGCNTGVSALLCGGGNTVTLAVLDTGVAFEAYNDAWYREYTGGGTYTDWTSLDFSQAPELGGSINFWTNPGENYTGADNDNNGICDDLHGADFVAWLDNLALLPTEAEWETQCNSGTEWVKKEGHPNDDDGHGTYVTGIMASQIDNSVGTSFGGAFKTTIMPVKVLDYTGVGSTLSLSYGIYYAVDHGAEVINMSIAGLTSPSSTLQSAVQYAQTNNVIIVAASGNLGLSSVEYPAAYSGSFNNVISVGALAPAGSEPSVADDAKASYSSYGSSLDLVAPVGNSSNAGSGTWSQTFQDQGSWGATVPTSRNFGTFSTQFGIGTSYAAPQVSAAAALLKAKSDLITAPEIKTLLRTTAQDVTTNGVGFDNQTGYGVLNIQAAWDSIGVGIWYPWILSGGTPYDVEMETLGSTLFQAVVDPTGYVWTRSTTGAVDGSNNPVWTPWVYNGATTTGKVYLTSSNGKIYQAVVAGGLVWTRYHTSGNLDGSNNPIWSGWIGSGNTNNPLTMVEFNNRLFQSIVLSNGYVLTRSTTGTLDGSNNPVWTSWVFNGATTTTKVYMGVAGTKIYQSVIANGYIWTRYHTSGNLDGGGVPIFGGWVMSGGTNGEVYMHAINNTLVQSVVAGGFVYTRSTAGTLDGSNNPIWTNWSLNGGTNGTVSMISVNNKFYQSVVAGGSVWTRYATLDGNGVPIWSGWIGSRNSSSDLFFQQLDNDLVFQAIVYNGQLYTRTTDGTLDGSNNPIWTGWTFNGGTNKNKVYMKNLGTKLFQSVIASNYVWTRYFLTN